MSENSPQRFKVLQQLGKDNPRYQRIKDFTYFRFRMLQNFKADDPALYQLRVNRLRIEDDIFGLVKDTKPDEQLANETKDKLREKIGALVDLGIKEREHRVERLQKM